jgi:hypothetical protein
LIIARRFNAGRDGEKPNPVPCRRLNRMAAVASMERAQARGEAALSVEILQPVWQRLNLGVKRAKNRGMAPLTQFDRRRPLVQLGEQGGFNLL